MGYEQINLVEEESKAKLKEIFALFKPVEGYKSFYYGHTRNGKTVLATSDILSLLDRGEIVVANWKIKWEGHDERKDFWTVFYKWLFGRKYLYHYKKDNFIYVPPKDVRSRLPELAKMVNVHYFFDEGQWVFNSSERYNADDPESVAKLSLILEGGHYCRSFNVISQRPSNIFKTMRSEINQWYRCEKVLTWPWLAFRKTTIEAVDSEFLPIEDDEYNKKELYWPSQRVLSAYDTHAMRAEDAQEKISDFDVYEVGFVSGFFNVLAFFRRSGTSRIDPAAPQVESERADRHPEMLDQEA